MPALTIVTILSLVPLLIVLLFTFLQKDTYGGVVWQFSGVAWTEVLFQRDIFDGTIGFADAHLSIFLRSLKISVLTTVDDPAAWRAHRLFHRDPAQILPQYLAVPHHRAVLDQPSDPDHRDP
ncbi:hypothetical protein [Primorskyibacter sp. 2E107]|uniref:hypothetical protein n=1 Tax=Primorskyibacter sp. 2E107 TaxID=3403458 RepID=UPI003AF4B96F